MNALTTIPARDVRTLQQSERSVRVCVVSKADSFGGGASRVAEELTELINASGHYAHHLCAFTGKGFIDGRRSLYGKRPEKAIEQHARGKRWGFPELIPFELRNIRRMNLVDSYDIFHFHDISSVISPLTLRYIARYKPVVWTIHDCSPFTGGCLYPMDCTNFQGPGGCGNCPQLGEWPIDTTRDFTRFMRRVKAFVHRGNVTTVTPSNWMADLAQSSTILPNRPVVISNAINTDLYRPLDKQALRDEMGIPRDRPVFVLSAGNISDPRKGVRYSLDVLRQLKDLNPFIVAIGHTDEKFLKSVEELDVLAPGYISTQSDLNRYYSVADSFLFCSLADNQPLAVIEALASGTSVTGFATGGIVELVDQDVTGHLVPTGDTNALVAVLRKAIEEDTFGSWCAAARDQAVSRFSQPRLIDEHLALYKSLLWNETFG